MNPREYLSGASATPPTAPSSPSVGYPTGGNPGTATPPTVPGPHWFHQISEELRGVIAAGGLVPNSADLTQLNTVLQAMFGGVSLLSVIPPPGFTGPYPPPHGFRVKGLIVQWAKVAIGDIPIGTPGGSGSVTFLTPFTGACLMAIPSIELPAGGSSNVSVVSTGSTLTASSFQIQEWSAAVQAAGTVTVLAVGF